MYRASTESRGKMAYRPTGKASEHEMPDNTMTDKNNEDNSTSKIKTKNVGLILGHAACTLIRMCYCPLLLFF